MYTIYTLAQTSSIDLLSIPMNDWPREVKNKISVLLSNALISKEYLALDAAHDRKEYIARKVCALQSQIEF